MTIRDRLQQKPSDRMIMFDSHFTQWRRKRLDKLYSILGNDWFQGKTVLELGAGYGHIGKELESLGAIVTFAEGREDYLPFIRDGANSSDILLLDNDLPWNLGTKFDLVIHFGLLYHLKNWREDLRTALAHGMMLCLDTEVLDSSDETVEFARSEKGYDQSLHEVGVRPSVAAIEAELPDTAIRYDDADLNIGDIPGGGNEGNRMLYDWKAGDYPNGWHEGIKRFWFIRVA